VKARKETIRGEILAEHREALANHVSAVGEGLPAPIRVEADFAGAMKGKKTVKSLRDACGQVLADAKIEADAEARRIRTNTDALDATTADHPTLFPDRAQLVVKAREDMEAAIKARIAEHEAEESRRQEAERERIRQEEERKAREAEQARQEADEKRKAEERRNQEEAERRAQGKCDGNNGGPPCEDPECWLRGYEEWRAEEAPISQPSTEEVVAEAPLPSAEAPSADAQDIQLLNTALSDGEGGIWVSTRPGVRDHLSQGAATHLRDSLTVALRAARKVAA